MIRNPSMSFRRVPDKLKPLYRKKFMSTIQTNLNESTVLEYQDLIEEMAYVAFSKVKKPATMEVEDLIQDGSLACIKAIQSWDSSKGASISTWITTILRNYFYDIVWYSYRKVDSIAVENFDLFHHRENSKEEAVGFLDWIQCKLSFEERRYIKCCLLEKQINPKDFRIRVRKKLGLEENVEDFLRSSIRESIQVSKGI